MALKDEQWSAEEFAYESFPSALRKLTAATDIDTLLLLTDSADSVFGTRRAFSEAVGVGESTVAGWIKDAKMPPLGKAVVGLSWLVLALKQSVIDYERESSNLGDMIVRDGDCFMIVSFRDADRIGEVAARNIPDMETASRLVSHRELRHALKLAIGEISAPVASRRLRDIDSLVAYLESLVDDVSNKASSSFGQELKGLAEEILSEQAGIEEGGDHA